MNKRGTLFVLLLAVFASKAAIAEEEHVVVPVNLSLVPALSIGRPAGYKTINYVQLNVVAGYADILKGAAFGVVSIVGGNAIGLQEGVVNWAGDLTGVQAGVVNTVLHTAGGAQAGVVNYAKDTTFAQAGVVNISGHVKGVQFGVVNFAVENEGVPIGLISIVARNGQTHAQAWYDETGLMNAALIHGTRKIYNIYTTGIDSQFSDLTVGLGLGVHVPLKKVFLNFESIWGAVSPADAIAVEWENLLRTRLYVGYDFRALSLIGGVSFNYMSNKNATSISLDPFHGLEFESSSGRSRYWPGLFLGVQF